MPWGDFDPRWGRRLEGSKSKNVHLSPCPSCAATIPQRPGSPTCFEGVCQVEGRGAHGALERHA